MRALSVLFLFAVLTVVGSGCTNRPSSNESETVEVVLEPIEVPANVNEAELVFYEDPTSPILLDIWLPPNETGATLAQFHRDGATGSV